MPPSRGELACDARTLRVLGDDARPAYGRALLGMIAPKPVRAQLLSGATTMQCGKRSLRERITLIAKKPKMAAYTLIVVLLLCAALAACTFTGAASKPEPASQPVSEPAAPAEQETALPAQQLPEQETAQQEPQPIENDPEAEFQALFPELDFASLQDYLESHPEALDGGWEKLHLNEAGLDDAGTSIATQQGDQVLAIDAEYGILLVRAAGDGYRGVLAICRYPELLRLEMAVNYLSAETDVSKGEQAGSIASRSGGILAMSGSGYFSPGGDWDNDAVASWCMSRGQAYFKHNGVDSFWRRIELSENGLNCRIVPASEQVGEGTYNAAEFAPALIVDGEACDVTYWTGEQPRACFGEGNGTIYMLVIEGYYPENGIYGIGLDTCTEILLSYGCRNALNMNGGSSAILWYDGEYITQSSSSFLRDTGGRPLPNAWVYG